jgi:diaminohydroxyphosphoribosylaminopyrimidine deaminase / 5-amino-6-(5-phosphoribosylamino)uracil reductase
MAECLSLARKGEGYVSPNPLVGAVLVENNKIVARGYHRRFGGPHAEVECVGRYSGRFDSTTLYVNLEPCSFYGKTPPCVNVILEVGIPRVVVAMKDPNPRVSGRGIRMLRRNGIRLTTGILENEARELNRKFVTWMTARRPYINIKIAQTLDGKIAGHAGTVRQISGRESLALVHRWRSEYDAVLVGAGTIRADDPLLTVRNVKGRNPDVVILDGGFTVSPNARVFGTTGHRRVFVCVDRNATRGKGAARQRLLERGVHVLPCRGKKYLIPLQELLVELKRYNIGSILVEGGSRVFSQFIHDEMYDEINVFVAPRIMGEGVPSFSPMETRSTLPDTKLNRIETRHIGRDILIRGFVD